MMLPLSNIGLCRQLLIIFLLVFSSRAYIIDDANDTVTYSSDLGSARWARLNMTSSMYLTSSNGSVLSLDYSRFYGQTLSFANCNATSFCQITMPFTGSGISIHGVLFPGVSNFTISIDGKDESPPFLHPPVPEESPPLYNITIYELQNLSLSSHVLVITLVAWQLAASELALDYVDVNELPFVPKPSMTQPATPIPTYSGYTFSAYPSPVTVATRSKGVVIGAAVGGTIGGLVVIASIVALVLFLRRSKPVPETVDESKHASLFSSSPHQPLQPEPYLHSPYSTHTTAPPTPYLPQL